MRALSEWLYAHGQCIACGHKEDLRSGLCTACADALDGMRLSVDQRMIPGVEAPAYGAALGAFAYRGCVRAITLALKYHGDALPAKERLVPAMVELARAMDGGWTAVVPVPLSKARMAERGYNQSGILAEGVARALRLPIREGWLWRARDTKQQARLTREERIANVRGAFTADVRVRGQALLLIDDVLTSGATVSACAKALLNKGALGVDVLAGARALMDDDG
jgi:ComF family protein